MKIPWNRVKIVATAGPASNNYKTLKAMICSGLDIVRINFSHGNIGEYKKTISLVRKIENELNRPIGILADMPGPKLRVRGLPGGNPIIAKNNAVLKIVTGKIAAENEFNISHPAILKALVPGAQIYISDGKIRIRVLKTGRQSVLCKVIAGGEIKQGAGLNFPDIDLPIPSVTADDYRNIKFCAAHGVDFIGLSFVKDARDVKRVKTFIGGFKHKPFIISKIERRFAIDNLIGIIDATDGVMVARGDLGVELPIERISNLQKDIIRRCNAAGKPVITATQMLESMIDNPSPTRAEVSDVANAIFDGTDAIMLSGETAVGKYPVDSVVMMEKIAVQAEKKYNFDVHIGKTVKRDITDIISQSVADIALDYSVKAIVIPTLSGKTARVVSRHRPSPMIIALAAGQDVQRQLTLSWGVYPVYSAKQHPSVVMNTVSRFIRTSDLFRKGDRVIIAAGTIDKGGDLSNIIKIAQV